MYISPVKKRIIQVLFILAVLALVANLIVIKYFKGAIQKKEKDFNSNFINERFIGDLRSFGIKNDWIKDLSKDKSDRSFYSYKVDLPKDLPIPVVLSEIYSSFFTSDVKIQSVEKTIGKKTILEIFSKNLLDLSAEFNYNENIRRDAGNIGLIIFDLEKLNAKDINAIVDFPQALVAAVIPSKEDLKLASDLINNRKELAVYLNDDIKDPDYKLSKDYSNFRLSIAIRSIISDFSNAIFFVIDDHSKIYQSPAFNFIQNEFFKRNIKLIPVSSLDVIQDGNKAGIKTSFRSLVLKTHSGDNKLIAIHADEFEILKPEIFSLIKIGYKFITPSIVIDLNKSKSLNN